MTDPYAELPPEAMALLVPPAPPKDIQFNLRSVFEDGVLPVLETYLDMEHEFSYDAMFCWAVGSYILDVFDTYPYLYFVGMKRCGKSRALIVLSKLCNDSVLAVNCSTSAAFHLAERGASLFFDELEWLRSEDKQDLRLLFTAGYRRGMNAIRMEKDEEGNQQVREFKVFCPKAMASIGRPDDVLADRSLLLEMRRSINREVVNQIIDHEIAPSPCPLAWTAFRELIKQLAILKKEEIRKAYKELRDPSMLARDWEMWRPLLAIAKAGLGDDYYLRIREYAIRMTAAKQDDEQFGLEAAILPVLHQLATELSGRVPLSDLYKRLKEDESFEWLTAKFLSKTLKNMGLKTWKSMGRMVFKIKAAEVEALASRLSITLKEEEEKREGGEERG